MKKEFTFDTASTIENCYYDLMNVKCLVCLLGDCLCEWNENVSSYEMGRTLKIVENSLESVMDCIMQAISEPS